MKIFFTFIMLAVTLAACNKNCIADAEACKETVPTDEQCEALFKRWFYNEDSKTCELKTYGGCSRKGFENKEECETCKCK